MVSEMKSRKRPKGDTEDPWLIFIFQKLLKGDFDIPYDRWTNNLGHEIGEKRNKNTNASRSENPGKTITPRVGWAEIMETRKQKDPAHRSPGLRAVHPRLERTLWMRNQDGFALNGRGGRIQFRPGILPAGKSGV